jgi:hypothetical protein
VVEVAEVVKPGIKRKRSLARSACAQEGRLHAGLPARGPACGPACTCLCSSSIGPPEKVACVAGNMVKMRYFHHEVRGDVNWVFHGC